jgi:hypothetical protein
MRSPVAGSCIQIPYARSRFGSNRGAPFPLTRANFTIPGASVAAIYYPTYQQLEVFVIDKNGVLNVVWKDHNGPWHAPVGLTGPVFAPPGAPLAAVYQPLNEQLEVFVVGASGALNVVWKDNNGIWKRCKT